MKTDYSFSSIFFGFLLPILLITASVFWTIKTAYKNRFVPIITLFFLSIIIFLLPAVLAYFEIITGSMGFAVAILSVYYSIALLIGIALNVMVDYYDQKEKVIFSV
ncbi:hypothetical protein [Jeotgalibacillus campisalis]|uniref:hypothetical protein n=1 Tax=Jeotgalibacillus campisalis TaxID=220754 RepID=UPI0005975D5B|nr:hypothetical protein [Jeotgalibacillus campisalis]